MSNRQVFFVRMIVLGILRELSPSQYLPVKTSAEDRKYSYNKDTTVKIKIIGRCRTSDVFRALCHDHGAVPSREFT